MAGSEEELRSVGSQHRENSRMKFHLSKILIGRGMQSVVRFECSPDDEARDALPLRDLNDLSQHVNSPGPGSEHTYAGWGSI